MNTARRTFRNALLLLVGHTANGIFFYLLFVVVGRRLGEAQFGAFSTTLVAVNLLNAICAFGTDAYIVREVAKRLAPPVRIALRPFALRLLASSIAIGVVSLWVRGFGGIGLPWSPVVLSSLSLYVWSIAPTSVSQVCWAVGDGLERMEYRVGLSLALFAGKAMGGMAALYLGHGLHGVLTTLLAVDVAVAMGSLIAIAPTLRGAWGVDTPVGGALIRTMLPFTLLGILQIVYFKIDVLMLAAMRGDAEVGWYSASSRVLEGLLVVPMAVVGSLYPAMSRVFQTGERDLTWILSRSVKVLIALALPLALGIFLIAQPFLGALFGPSYLPQSSHALMVLIWTILPIYAGAPLARTLYILERPGVVLGISLAGVFVNVGLNLALIPSHGLMGAATATLVSELLLFAALFSLVTKALGTWWPDGRAWRIVITSFVSTIPLLSAADSSSALGLVFRVMAQVLLYTVLTIFLRVLDPEDYRLFRKVINR